MWFPGLAPPQAAHFTGGHPIDGKAQVTREQTGHPAADGAWGPPGPPRPRPSRAGSGPFPGAVTGPMPRFPASHGQPDDDPWSGTAPGFEFERRRLRPSRAPRRTPPGQPGHPRAPRAHPVAEAEPRRFRYTPTVSQPLSAPTQAWPDDDVLTSPGLEFGETAPAGPARPPG